MIISTQCIESFLFSVGGFGRVSLCTRFSAYVLFMLYVTWVICFNCRGEQERLPSVVWSWADVRDLENALLLSILLQTGTDASVSKYDIRHNVFLFDLHVLKWCNKMLYEYNWNYCTVIVAHAALWKPLWINVLWYNVFYLLLYFITCPTYLLIIAWGNLRFFERLLVGTCSIRLGLMILEWWWLWVKLMTISADCKRQSAVTGKRGLLAMWRVWH